MFVNFILNKKNTFPKSNRLMKHEAKTFILIALIGLLFTNILSLIIMITLQRAFENNLSSSIIRTFSHISSVAFVSIYSFFGHKFFTFNEGISKYLSKNK